MVKFSNALSMFLLASWTQDASAGAFLQAQPDAESKYVARHDIEQLLRVGLSGDAAHLESVQRDLAPMYAALPKGVHGKLEPSTVRYALHRYFLQRHGWNVRGLDANDRGYNLSSATTILKDRVPDFILSLFEKHVHSQGLGLHELAVFATTLVGLIHAEAVGTVENIFDWLHLPMTGPVTSAQYDLAVKAYLLSYVHEDFTGVEWQNASHVEQAEEELKELMPFYNDTLMWVQDFRQAYNLERKHHRNPFIEHPDTFGEAVAFVQAVGHHYGFYQNHDCRTLKHKLLKKDVSATGRVRLSDFYAFRGTHEMLFSESEAYLRNLGALDETDPSKPSVMIPNYLTSLTNCISTSSFYSMCCLNECHSLLEKLEVEIASPSAEPKRIADVISQLRSETVDAPRNLSLDLLARLEDIADFNDGLVPLHGRLFTQWMHHAYPRECPFPPVVDAQRQKTITEWVDEGGVYMASAEEMRLHRSRRREASLVPEVLPWAAEEELVVEPERWTSASLQSFMALAAVLSFAVPLLRGAAALVSSALESKWEESTAQKASGKSGAKPRKRKLEERVV